MALATPMARNMDETNVINHPAKRSAVQPNLVVVILSLLLLFRKKIGSGFY